jgi:molybdopterin converting factor small subunit
LAPVIVELPSVLAPLVAGQRTVSVEAQDLREALDALFARHPILRGQLFDEQGRWRPHVLCFLNQTNHRWLALDRVPLASGDRIVILQAVSGG